MAAPASSPTAAANALSAFLKGVERRALVVAGLQTGNPAAAVRAVAVAMRAFAGPAADLPMADWPLRFWGLLCGTPRLREPAQGDWPAPLAHLQALAPGERLALLLRIGAGLDEEVAPVVLGLESALYRRALARACPVDAQGQPDAQAWRALAEQVQAQVRDLPPARLQQLEQLRDTTAADRPAQQPAAPAKSAAPMSARRPRRAKARWSWRTWLLLCLPLLLLALVAAWWWQERMSPGTGAAPAEGAVADAGPVQVETLSEEDSPAAAPAADSRAADDAAMLADPDLGLAQDADFYAWHAAGGPVPADESQAPPSRAEPAATALETVDADD